jgi:hypothetical protein
MSNCDCLMKVYFLKSMSLWKCLNMITNVFIVRVTKGYKIASLPKNDAKFKWYTLCIYLIGALVHRASPF